MKIRKELIEKLHKEGPFLVDDILCVLLCLYYNLVPSIIEKVALREICTYLLEKGYIDKGFHVIVLLFGEEEKSEEKSEEDTPWTWVKTEYIPLFTELGKDEHSKESVSRMKKFFSENPDIRKDEVVEATKMYIRSTDSKYVRQPHYFISKGAGVEKLSDLLLWIGKYRTFYTPEIQERNISRKLQ